MKIGITMRVSIFKNERRDCIDQEWFNYFEKFGFELIPIPNTKDDLNRYIKNSNFRVT